MASSHKKLLQEAQKGWLWTGLEQFFQRGLAMVVSIVLARLLGPKDFGLIASIAIFINISQQLINGGIAQRIIQKNDLKESDYDALFWCNLGMSGFIFLLLSGLSRGVSVFFGEAQLMYIMPAMAGIVVLMNAGRVQETKLVRSLHFKALSLCRISSVIGGCGMGLIMAFKGFGVWALLGQQAIAAVIYVSLLLIRVPWRPKKWPRYEAVKDLYTFGGPIMASQVIRVFAEQSINVFIARRFAVADLGYYERGRFMPQNIGFSLQAIFLRANFPILSRLQDQPEGFVKMYKHIMASTCGIAMLLLAGLIVYAEDVVTILLSEKWLPSVWYLQISCGVCISYIIYTLNLDLLRALGKTKKIFQINLLYSFLQILCIIIGGVWGLHGLVLGNLLGRVLGCILIIWAVSGVSVIRINMQLKALVMPLLFSSVLFFVLWIVRESLPCLWWRVGIAAGIGTTFLLIYWKRVCAAPIKEPAEPNDCN